MSFVKFGNVASRINIHVDQATTTLEYYIGGEHINGSDFMVHDRAPIKGSTIGYQFQFGFEKGDILFMTKNPHLRKASMVDFDGLCSIATFVIRTKDESLLLQKYLLIEMQSNRFWNYCEEHKSGGVNYFINWGTLSNYEFNLPSLAEQKVLAEKLWAAYEVKQSYLRMIEATQQMVKSQFIEMFGNERIEDCKWQNLPMGHVFEISSSRRVLKEQWTSDGVPFLRVRDMVDLAQGKELNNEAFISEKYYNNLSDDDGKVREGDIIISATSTIGKCYLIKKGDRFYYKDADILRLRKQKEINCSYFMYAFNMPTIAMQVEESIGKTTVGHFLISKAQNIKIPMPPIELQVQFESILRQADKSGFELRKSIDAIDKVIKSLINENL